MAIPDKEKDLVARLWHKGLAVWEIRDQLASELNKNLTTDAVKKRIAKLDLPPRGRGWHWQHGHLALRNSIKIAEGFQRRKEINNG